MWEFTLKPTFTLIFVVYVLYNSFIYDYNKYAGMKPDISRKVFYQLTRGKCRVGASNPRRKCRVGANNTRTSRYVLLIRMLLLCGCIEYNPGPTTVSCPRCDQTFTHQQRLDNHLINATNESCDMCGASFCSRNRLEQHRRTAHIGGGVSNQPDGILNTPILPDTGHPQTSTYQEVIDDNYSLICNHTINTKTKKTVNKQLIPDFTYGDLKHLLMEIRRCETSAFKINIGFGSILFDTVRGVYRYFYVSANHLLFERACTISTNRDMTFFFDKIVSLDLANTYYMQRPSSGWVLAGLPNVEVQVMRMLGIPIGAGVQLPDHIKKSKSIIGLTHDTKHCHAFEDNLCLFRCLALFFKPPEQDFRTVLRSLERPANEFRRQLEQHTGKTYEEGLEIGMLGDVESSFNIGINVYSLQEDKTAKVIRLSDLDHQNVLHLNLYRDHFSFITKFKSYAKKFQCTICTRFIGRTDSLKLHMKKCQVKIKEVFKGGKFQNRKTVFELLDTILDIKVPEADRYDPYIAVYDFEALQIPIDETSQGRTLHFRHEPATVSICSNVPGYTEPDHFTSTGDVQTFIDEFVNKLLAIQAKRDSILTVKYQSYIEELQSKLQESQKKLGIGETEDQNTERDGREGEVDLVATGVKRKRKSKSKGRSKRPFLAMEADVSDDDSEDGEDSDDCDDDIEGLINDDDMEEEDNASFYRAFDNERPGPSTAAQPFESVVLSVEEQQVEEKRLKKVKTCLSMLMTYIGQLTILGFNSQKYDVPLIRHYLASSLIKYDGTPKQVIKKMGGYMSIATKRLKFLDITNFLAAGTSLVSFYESFQVSTPKGYFPYQWFDSLEKLEFPGLPADREKFRSILTNQTISDEEFQKCHRVWEDQGMTEFADYVKYYNNADVIGVVEAVEKMIANEKNNRLDIFKEAVSLPGVTQKYLFSRLGEDYFIGFGDEHKHLAKLLRDNIVGGPSIIFHRYQERDVTLIKGKHLCKTVKGYDANSLYLYCLGQLMPTGYYTVQEEANGYKRQTRYSRESIQWLEHVMRTTDAHIQHAENGGEKRIENVSVDGYDESTRTVYEYHGCFWHGHSCHTWYNADVWNKTVEREQKIRDLGYRVVSITSCEWLKMPESKEWYSTPEPTSSTTTTTMQTILDDVLNDRVFGFVKVWIHVPDILKKRFSEFPPIFKNAEITIADIGEHMQAFCRKNVRRTGVKRSLISSMHGEGILLLTPLLKKYLELGLVVTRLELLISYNGKAVFDWFVQEVCDDRRRADLGGPDLKMKGEASKLKGNCAYGRTLMNKLIHTLLSFVKEANLSKHVNNPFLKTYTPLNESVFEVEKQKKTVVHDMPLQIGVAVYSYAKLRMLEFWEFINTFLVNDLYQFMEMDTDSLYIAFARDTIDECVKPEMLERWVEEKWKWFSSEDNVTMTEFDEREITFSQWDQRTPGKFKTEYAGTGMSCLNSKVYTGWGGINKKGEPYTKTSCKSVQQKRNRLLKAHFLNVLSTANPHLVENAGFVKDTNGTTKTYTQTKVGMSYFYAKRKVLADGVTTTHLDI